MCAAGHFLRVRQTPGGLQTATTAPTAAATRAGSGRSSLQSRWPAATASAHDRHCASCLRWRPEIPWIAAVGDRRHCWPTTRRMSAGRQEDSPPWLHGPSRLRVVVCDSYQPAVIPLVAHDAAACAEALMVAVGPRERLLPGYCSAPFRSCWTWCVYVRMCLWACVCGRA
ncbi:hypothetical protein DL89DRAFT_136536 [Linderina pennispora]|uniref:Uncharacterized protein n=1 Tax=Linderina pennispora TaxID=61395 RepID=A0A1Y1WB73_9FUNG|nr:uncharacterized protein DL89DRAFT_136536 [Linderina pennispora]ORX70615.1 hypothetical protein DL89DRAFT_136536 [Linderina pennispora]